jgi:hypothetical protein
MRHAQQAVPDHVDAMPPAAPRSLAGRRRIAYGERMHRWPVVVLLACTACSVPMGHVGALATPPVKVSGQPVQQRVVGRDCGAAVLYVPLGRSAPVVEAAVRDALARAPGSDALVGVAMNSEVLSVPPFYQRTCLVVRGDAMRTRGEQP